MDLKDLKSIVKTDTAFIMGNAPSLLWLPVDKLIMYPHVFWVNRAYKLKDLGYNFHPNYYCVANKKAFIQYEEEMMNVKAGYKFFRRNITQYIGQSDKKYALGQNIVPIDYVPDYRLDDGRWNYEIGDKGIVDGHTVVLDAVQIAAYMGYKRIVVGGVDLDYNINKPYFYNMDSNDPMPVMIPIDRAVESFKTARVHLDAIGVKLLTLKRNLLPLEYIGFDDVWDTI